MATSRGVRIHRFGGPEVLQMEDLPMPTPRGDEVVVRVHAASVLIHGAAGVVGHLAVQFAKPGGA